MYATLSEIIISFCCAKLKYICTISNLRHFSTVSVHSPKYLNRLLKYAKTHSHKFETKRMVFALRDKMDQSVSIWKIGEEKCG